MRRVRKDFEKSRYKYFLWQNTYLQLWYNFHQKFYGSLISKGKKAKAFNIFLKIKKGLKAHEKFDPFLVFLVAMIRISPTIILLPLKASGVTQGVPFPINEKKKVTFAIKWVIKLLRENYRVYKVSTVVDILISSIYNKGLAIQKRDEVYKISFRNRHFIRYFK